MVNCYSFEYSFHFIDPFLRLIMTYNDCSYLICSYLIIADGEINIKETDVLHHVFDNLDIANVIEEEQKKIFADDPEKIDIKVLEGHLGNTSQENLYNLFKTLFSIAYADGYYDVAERNFIDSLATKLKLDRNKLTLIENEVANLHVFRPKKEHWAETLKAAFERLIYELKDDKDKEYEFELLSGANFSRKITAIAKSSEEDLKISDEQMRSLNNVLRRQVYSIEKIIDKIKEKERKDDSTKGVIEIVENLYTDINENILTSLQANLEILNKKKRTAHYFTIAFMGRTKAGKSTFHKVVTHEKNDDIGVGKLRTTRYNRCWYWENLRIIDTPGIGAPGGETDENIAQSIVDEADLICYLVTNDSIQQTEFNFLGKLKEKNKPLFIILNVKQNLDRIRLKRFIKDPTAWLYTTGPQNIQGHVDRIYECIGNKYDCSAIQIIPLQLLAAKMYFGQEGLTHEENEALLKGSNIREFVRAIKSCVFRSGNIKKTLNIVDGCYVQIHEIHILLNAMSSNLSEQHRLLKNNMEKLCKFIADESERTKRLLFDSITEAHNKLRNNSVSFADINYEDEDNKSIQEKWANYDLNKIVYGKLNRDVENAIFSFQASVKEKVEECFDDFQFALSQKDLNSKLQGAVVWNTKRCAIIGTGIGTMVVTMFSLKIGAILVSVTNLWNPVGWAVAITLSVGALAIGITSLFTSKAKKIQKAKEKMTKALKESIDKNESEMKQKVLADFSDMVRKLDTDFRYNFTTILDNLQKLIVLLNDICRDCDNSLNSLNIVLAYRIIQLLKPQLNKAIEDYGMNNLSNHFSVERNDKSNLVIFSPYELDVEDEKIASELTQLTIKFLNYGTDKI